MSLAVDAQPRAGRPGGAAGHRRGAPGQRPAELHAGRAGRHRGEGGARARARGAAEQRPRSSRTTSASRSTWRRPTCPRSPAASTCRSRSASWPPAGRSTPQRLDALRVRRRAVAGRRAAAGARRAGDGLALQRAGAQRALVLPAASAARGGAGRRARGARAPRHLLDVVRALPPGDAPPSAAWPGRASQRRPRRRRRADLRDVKGQAGAKRALEIAAAGGHSLLMVGPPGTGKSMLAQRFAGLLPPMTRTRRWQAPRVPAWPARLRRCALGPAAGARAAPHRERGGAGGRRLTAAARARSRWRTTACCSSTSCRSSPRAALEALREPLETRPHHDLARGAPGRRSRRASSWWRR